MYEHAKNFVSDGSVLPLYYFALFFPVLLPLSTLPNYSLTSWTGETAKEELYKYLHTADFHESLRNRAIPNFGDFASDQEKVIPSFLRIFQTIIIITFIKHL